MIKTKEIILKRKNSEVEEKTRDFFSKKTFLFKIFS